MNSVGRPNPYSQNYQSAVWKAERGKWTALFDHQVRWANIPEPQSEFLFHPTRFWRFDRAWPDVKLAVEIEGGIYRRGGGAHTHPNNFLRDVEKYNAGTLLGWRILRFAEPHLNSPYAIESVVAALKRG